MNKRYIRTRHTAHFLSAFFLGLIDSAGAQVPALAPSDHCRDFPPEQCQLCRFRPSRSCKRRTWSRSDDALCEQAASLELIVGTTIERVVYGGPCLHRKNPLKAWKAFKILQDSHAP